MLANLLDEGVELELMKSVDPADATKKFFEDELPKRVPNPTAALLFHCGGRAWVANALGKPASGNGG